MKNEIRILFETNYTQIPNQLLRDKQVSLKAKGMFCLLISHGERYQFSSNRLLFESSDGEHATKASLKELEHYKYLIRHKLPSGRMQYILQLPDHAEPKCENPTEGKSHNEKTPQGENRTHKEDRSINNTDLIKKTDITPPSRAEIPTECFTIADMLIIFIKKQFGTNRSSQRRSYADTIRKMSKIDQIEFGVIARGVKFYIELDEYPQHCPVIQSAEALRKKWESLVNYARRLENDSNRRDSVSQRVMSDLDLIMKPGK